LSGKRGLEKRNGAADRSSRLALPAMIFPQMSLWLPEEEGAQLRLAFEKEMERLKAA
jgi:hypothetical protein